MSFLSFLQRIITVRQKYRRCENCSFWQKHQINGYCIKRPPVWDGRKPTSAGYPGKDEYSDWSGQSAIVPTTQRETSCGAWSDNGWRVKWNVWMIKDFVKRCEQQSKGE